MIAKVIVRRGETKSFKRLAAYVLNEKDGGRGDPVGWKLADYILDADHQGEKVRSHRVTNCLSTNPGWAVKECLALAALNTRSKRDKAYHLVVSFPKGEVPADEQLVDIEDSIVKSVGMEGHKRLSAIHQNTDYLHMHIAIVTVHPVTLRNMAPYRDHFRLQEACADLEIKHGLQRTNHTLNAEHARSGGERDREAHTVRAAFGEWLKGPRGEQIAEAGRRAASWAELHTALAAFDVTIKPRGAGLIIAHRQNGKIRIKASEVSRALSFTRLTDRLGAYQPPGQEHAAITALSSFDGRPADAADKPDQWAEYQRARAEAEQLRAATLARLKEQHVSYGRELAAWYDKRFAATRDARLSRPDRSYAYDQLRAQKNKDRKERIVRERAERDAARKATIIPTWQTFQHDKDGGTGFNQQKDRVKPLEQGRTGVHRTTNKTTMDRHHDGRDAGR